MTGNNKVWRMPVAGLASVAMLATLGAGAMTANAAEVEGQVTVHGNGLKINYVDNGETKSVDDYTITYKYEATDADAQADALAAELTELTDGNTAEGNAELLVGDAVVFTGFFKSAAYGVENDAFNKGVEVASDLYVHYGYADNEIVTVDDDNVGAGFDSKLPNHLAYKGGALDRIADWQVPTDSDFGDDILAEYFTVQEDQRVDDLTADLSGVLAYGTSTLNIVVKLVDASDIVKVTFNPWGTTAGKQYTIQQQQDGSSAATARVFALASGESFSDRYEVPTATSVADEHTTSTSWATRRQNDDGEYETDQVFDPSAAVNEALGLYVAETATTYTVTFDFDNGKDAIQTVKVAKGDTVSAPADPTKDEDETYMLRYSFDKWMDGTDEYDFSKPVNDDLKLTASYAVSEVGVKFDPAHDNEPAEIVWFETGDKFTVPENPTRDGYTFTGWVDNNQTSPDKFVGADLRIDENGNLQRIVVTAGDDVSGSKTTWTTIQHRVFTAQWDPADPEDTLDKLEGVVPDAFLRNAQGGYKSGDEQNVFTADSFDQFVSDYQDYLAAKNEAAGNGLTNDEAAELYAQLKDAQSGLVFKATKTTQRWEKNGQHIYTDSAEEQDNLKLAGWKHETLADFNTVDVESIYAEIEGDDVANAIIDGLLTEVSRLRNYATGNYMLTADQNEVNVLTVEQKTWKNETFSAVYTPNNGDVAADRFYVNYNGEHLIITDVEESDALKADSASFHYDGVKFWVY
ncbi:InlB B-repeat-containing protein [Bifidobacterium pullorum]|uniref:InlB B-repeat-containing protein n=1 Tax=Bifidobacterium pullorum TaxID=78448 RepID=UPI0025A385ED|nr:InlB B-repeat-containing protein [Bifidobacterium pullorum]MDM8322791.1 InlB B-repeat-containing protein [Bifidobacterium pullorum]